MLIQVPHVVSQSFLSSNSRSYVLELLLNKLLGLRMVEVIEVEPEGFILGIEF